MTYQIYNKSEQEIQRDSHKVVGTKPHKLVSVSDGTDALAINDNGSINVREVMTAFSTTSLLGSSAEYDSGILDLTTYTQVQTHILSDQDGTITVEFLSDSGGSDIVRTLTVPYSATNGFQLFSAPAFSPYAKYKFTNGTTAQGDFFYETKFLKTPLSAQILGVDSFIAPNMTANLGRNVIVGRTTGGVYNNVSIEPVTNALNINLPRSAFGELTSVQPTPVVQVDFVYNVNADLVNSAITGSGTVTQADSMVVLQTTANASSSAMVESKRFVKYRPGQGVVVRGTALFTTGVANSEQLFGAGDVDDGLFFGYDGATFGILRRVNGVDNWTAQTAWNGDVMDGSGSSSNPSGQTLDPTKGNVFQIRFQWLGFGRIAFGIEDEDTGGFIAVHSIAYANNFTTPSLYNPSFPVLWSVENTTNNTNITLKGASAFAEIEGKIEYLGPTNATGNTKTGVTTTLTSIVTIRNKSTYQTLTNRTPINILKYSASVDGNKPAEFQLVKNATLGGTPSYTDISTNTSVVEYDTAGTTVTGGQIIDFATLASSGSLSEGGTATTDIIILPGETLTLAINATNATTDATAAIRWVEDF
jgi:hypothetical protein